MASKTVNASEASYEVLAQVKKDMQDSLNIPISLSDAIQIASAAYFELKQLKKNKVSGITFTSMDANKDVHMTIDGRHDPNVCPECIQPGVLENMDKGVSR